jgi:hypothetical protein
LPEVGGATLVNPAKKLRRPETLFPQLLTKSRQRVQIEFKQIGAHARPVYENTARKGKTRPKGSGLPHNWPGQP